MLDQAGSPARFANEDGGARIPLRPAPPSSPLGALASRLAQPVDQAWTLGGAGASLTGDIDHFDITRLALDPAGVHEIKPAFNPSGSSGEPVDWAASWSAARAFVLAMMVQRLDFCENRRPILWCLPRGAKAEHGTPYLHGLQRLGFSPADVLIVEAGNARDTLWVLEEGLKSESLALVAGIIDDVALTPARRLALAAQKHSTPCLLLTHPRMPPVGATATRWRVAARSSAPHALNRNLKEHPFPKAPGARRLALTLERCRASPEHVTGQEIIVEWSDETFCLHMVAGLFDRSHAPRAAGSGAAGYAPGAG